MIIRALALGAIALLVAPAPAQHAATQTAQQQFDAAVALDQGTDKAAALKAWEAFAPRVAKLPRSRSVVLLRESVDLMALGRSDEALVAARAGLAGLPAQDKALDEDRFNGWVTIARLARGSLDFAGAVDAYRNAEQFAPDPASKISANLGLANTATFVDPALATAALARIDAIVTVNKVAPPVVAFIEEQRALLLLNTGDAAGAAKHATEAVKQQGGLTERTDLYDVSARSTAALALLLAHRSSEARHYMAMTGAGRLPNGTFDPAVQMPAPDCGGEGGLRPDDVAVIEFGIGDDGTVTSAAPIYAAGGGSVALQFARVARTWSWTPEQVKALPVFFRHGVRVEMRCSRLFERPAIRQRLATDVDAWLTGKGVPPPSLSDASDAAIVASERAALALPTRARRMGWRR